MRNLDKKFKIFSNIRKQLNLSHKSIFPFMEAENKNPIVQNGTFRGVPESLRYKPIAEFSLRNILRVQAIHNDAEKYFDTIQVVCGWARTFRYISYKTPLFIYIYL